MNREREPRLKREWELTTADLNRMDLNRPEKKPGKQPVWKFDRRHGKLERDSRGGIDWWRYRSKVLEFNVDVIWASTVPRKREDASLRPLCSHSAFSEGIRDLELTGED